MRIRTVKPEFWMHEGLSALPAETHMLAAALLNYADDEGYFNANTKLIQAACFPLRELSLSIHGMLTELSNVGFLRLGTSEDGRSYGHIVNFLEHQVINRPTASKIRGLEVVWERSLSAHEQLREDSLPERKGKEQGKERKPDKQMVREFEDWWAVYPRRVGKGKALDAYCKARKETDHATLMSALARANREYAGRDPDYIPHPTTWLNQKRWHDEDVKSKPKRDKAIDDIYATLD